MSDRWSKVLAVAGTVLLYGVVLVILSSLAPHSPRGSASDGGRALSVVYVAQTQREELSLDEPKPPERAVAQVASRAAEQLPRARTRPQDSEMEATAQSSDVPTRALPGQEGVSAASLLRSVQSSPITYAERQPWERDPALRRTAAPERFRMREQVAIEDVVREVSKFLGFWPPGYTDSPCPGLRVALNEVVGRPDADPDFVREITLAKAKFCD